MWQFCKRTYARRKRKMPKQQYGPVQHQIACTEIAMILEVYGKGSVVPVGYVGTFWKDRRLSRRRMEDVGVLDSTIDGVE